MTRFIFCFLISFFLSSPLICAKDYELEKELCTIRFNLYEYSYNLFGVDDTAIINYLDTLSLSRIKLVVTDKLSTTPNLESLQHFKTVLDYSKKIEGKSYATDYQNLIKMIDSVFCYATMIFEDKSELLKQKHLDFRKSAILTLVEYQANKGIVDPIAKEILSNSFSKIEITSNNYDHKRTNNDVLKNSSKSDGDNEGNNLPFEIRKNIDNPDESINRLKKYWDAFLLFFIVCLIAFAYYYLVYRRKYVIACKNDKLVNKKNGGIHKDKTIDTGQNGEGEDTEKQKSEAINILEQKSDVEARSIFSQDDNGFILDDSNICVIGASVIGNSHISMNLPCQDSCGYKILDKGWGIAVTSDGAGSATHSDVGSKVVIARALDYFTKIISTKGWILNNYIPSDAEWMQVSYFAIKAIRDDLNKFSQARGVEIKSLNATIIVVIHTSWGLLISHVGDGRAGYRNNNGEWMSIMTPHKGDEANQTIFVSSDFWDIPNYVMSGVMVPESRVIKDEISAFTLMSDGCEATSWLYNKYNENTGKYYDPNLPFQRFFDPLIDSLFSMHASDVDVNERLNKWNLFLKEGGKFATEPDDKTMILGVLVK